MFRVCSWGDEGPVFRGGHHCGVWWQHSVWGQPMEEVRCGHNAAGGERTRRSDGRRVGWGDMLVRWGPQRLFRPYDGARMYVHPHTVQYYEDARKAFADAAQERAPVAKHTVCVVV
jgi:hypothetical protein